MSTSTLARRTQSALAGAVLAVSTLVPLAQAPALAAGGTISGAVNQTADPTSGTADVCVSAFDLFGAHKGTAITDAPTPFDPPTPPAAGGNYTISGLEAGTYKVRFVDCGGNGLETEWSGDAGWFDAASSVTVTSSQAAAGTGPTVNADLTDGLTITGAVREDVTGAVVPLDGICVVAYDAASGAQVAETISRDGTNEADGDGDKFTLTGLRAGSYKLQFTDEDVNCADYTKLGGTVGVDAGTPPTDDSAAADGDGIHFSEFWMNQTSFGAATPVEAGATDINAALARKVPDTGPDRFQKVSGTVTDAGGAALVGIDVDFFRLDQDPATDNPAFSTVTVEEAAPNPAGHWQVTDELAGTYRIRFSDSDGQYATEWHQSQLTFSTATGVLLVKNEVEVVNENTDDNRTELALAGSVTGRVTVEGELTNVNNATVQVLTADAGEILASGTTNTDGLYVVTGIAPGEHKVRFLPTQSNLASEYYDNKLNLAAADTVAVTAGNTTAAINAALGQNNAPVAGDDNVQAEVNQTATFIDLTANDVDPDGDPVTITSVTQAGHGTVVLNTNGTVSFTPETNNESDTSFTYTIKDAGGLQDVATVNVEMTGEIIGTPPDARDDAATTDVGTAITIDVLANDTDPDGTSPLVIDSVGTPFHGTVSIQSAKLRYVPEAGFTGVDQFSYEVLDDQGFRDTAKVTVTVQADTTEETSRSASAGGTVATDGSSATASNPIITSVTTPNAGTITIKEEQVAAGMVSDISTATWRSVISAPNATAGNPLTITFRLDGSLLEGEQPARALRVLRNNTLVGDCLGSTTASPNPCISEHRMTGDDVLVTIKTSAASTWTFGFDNDAVVDRASGAPGTGRVGTAVAVSQNAYSPADVDTVIIARKDAYPDALAGAPLAHQLGAPMLLTTKDSLDAITRDEIVRLGASRVVILGGTAAVSSGVETSLRNIAGVTQVDRIRGADRFATAAAVAQQLDSYDLAYVVEGADADLSRGWPDAVAVASLAAFEGRPILLVTTEELPTATRNALSGLREAVIIGGTASVSTNVANAIDGVVGTVGRVRGTDRYETSFQVAQRAVNAGMSASSVWVATGQNFPDALAAGPAVAKEGGIMLLVNGTNYDASPAVDRFLTANRTKVESLTIVGGTAVISVGSEVRMGQATQN